ncbi:putative 3,4-dihydroxy-2-butanone kinase, partial [Eurytemora carolleeae]|uniref:putative 3,4-dihydroxy-2-butanone kinase n=1 Tax=Eurytemora carolleeae TaxID=1294199 RepID=UPI000C784A0B
YRDTKIRECGKNSFPLFFLQIDALYPALLVLEETGGKTGSLTAAGEAALTGAKKTATMVARAGRASYVSRDKVSEEDPGAVAAAAWFNVITSNL